MADHFPTFRRWGIGMTALAARLIAPVRGRPLGIHRLIASLAYLAAAGYWMLAPTSLRYANRMTMVNFFPVGVFALTSVLLATSTWISWRSDRWTSVSAALWVLIALDLSVPFQVWFLGSFGYTAFEWTQASIELSAGVVFVARATMGLRHAVRGQSRWPAAAELGTLLLGGLFLRGIVVAMLHLKAGSAGESITLGVAVYKYGLLAVSSLLLIGTVARLVLPAMVAREA